ncbi:MAG: hypothetical protein IKK80_02305 [Treponema sp.]|nr:hypothetical protein [Treponema sp.]
MKFYLGFNTNSKNGRVKALSKACLDRTYSSFTLSKSCQKKIPASEGAGIFSFTCHARE